MEAKMNIKDRVVEEVDLIKAKIAASKLPNLSEEDKESIREKLLQEIREYEKQNGNN
jgi:formiminotetrahydrofolate cyclodeaminase